MLANTLYQPTPQSLAGLGIARIALTSARRVGNAWRLVVAVDAGYIEWKAKQGMTTESIWKSGLIIISFCFLVDGFPLD